MVKHWKQIVCFLLCLFMTLQSPLSLIVVNAADDEEEIAGHVTFSIVDYGVRKDGEIDDIDTKFKNPLGVIVAPVEVPFYEGDTIAAVTVRYLESVGMTCNYSGSVTNSFFLNSIGSFTTQDGVYVESFGSYDSGAGSGWMITSNRWFINKVASEFTVEDGDVIEWQNTCQLGADIGYDYNSPSAMITGITVDSAYGTLSPAFNRETRRYGLNLAEGVSEICLDYQLENYGSCICYITLDGTKYRYNQKIPVKAGDVIKVATQWADGVNGTSLPLDEVTIYVLNPGETLPSESDELWSVKQSALAELRAYKNYSDYRTAQQTELTEIINSAKVQLDSAKTQAEINSIVADAKAEMDNVKTDAQLKQEEEETGIYEVTIKTAANINLKLYQCEGFDDEGYDITGKEVALTLDENTAEESLSYHYTASLPKGTYSYRGTDSEGRSLGGMTFTVPIAGEIGSDGNYLYTDQTVVLRKMDFYSKQQIDGKYLGVEDLNLEIYDNNMHKAVPGDGYVTSTGIPHKYALMYAHGNALLYTIQVTPRESLEGYASYSADNYTLAAGTTGDGSIAVTFPEASMVEITAPQGADVRVIYQKNLYNETDIVSTSKKINTDGTVTWGFPVGLGAAKSRYSYRVSMEGKITKAGILNLKSAETARTVITFDEDEDPSIRPDYHNPKESKMTSAEIIAKVEDGTLLNVNEKNYLRMDVGDSFWLRSYRAGWMIITDNSIDNRVLEPDYHFNVISGDSVTIEQDENFSYKGTIKAVKEGISIIEVTYDALELGGLTGYNGIYGATKPTRTGVMVVNVGGDSSVSIDYGVDWDGEFDTVYFLEDSSSFTFKPTAQVGDSMRSIDDVSVYHVLNGKVTQTAKGVRSSGAAYTVPIYPGANLVAVTSGDTVEYQLVRGEKLTLNVRNITSPGEAIQEGDEIGISFNGINMPVPKVPGMYNPGWPATMGIMYTLPDGTSQKGKGSQYSFVTPADHELTVTATADSEGKMKLTGGYIDMTMMSESNYGDHRNITAAGATENYNSVSIPATWGILPNLEIEVLPKKYYQIDFAGALNGSKICLTNHTRKITSELIVSEGQTVIEGLSGQYDYEISLSGYRAYRGSFTITSASPDEITIAIAQTEMKEAWDGSSVKEPQMQDNVYLISTPEELAWFAKRVNNRKTTLQARLTQNIDLGDYTWTAIASKQYSYVGTFDGDGYTISGLYIDNSEGYQGLFGAVNNGTIKNLIVEGQIHSSGNYTGGITGYLTGSKASLTSCVSKVEIVSTGKYIGGLAGYMDNGAAITASYVSGSVTGEEDTGCLAGSVEKASVQSSYGFDKTLVGSQKNAELIDVYSKDDLSKAKLLEALNKSTGAFLADTQGSNEGYPVLCIETESGKAILEAREQAKTQIEEYADYSLYRKAQQETIRKFVSAGVIKINNLTTLEEIAESVSSVKASIDKVETDEQLTKKEEQQQQQQTTLPKAPVLKSAKATAYQKIQLTWSSVKNVKGYVIYRKVTGGNYQKLAAVSGASKTTYTDTKAKLGTTYLYMVRSQTTADGKTVLSEDSNFKAASTNYPAKVTLKSVKAAKKTSQIQVNWKKVDKATGYYVYRKSGSKGSFKKIAVISKASTLTYTDKSAVCGTNYYYAVAAYRKVSGSTYKGTKSTASKKVVNNIPGTVKLNGVTAGVKKASVKWKKAAGASGYEVYYAVKKSGKYTKLKTVSGVKYTHTKLKKGKTYYYKVRAYKKVNGKKVYGAYSTVKSVKIKK